MTGVIMRWMKDTWTDNADDLDVRYLREEGSGGLPCRAVSKDCMVPAGSCNF